MSSMFPISPLQIQTTSVDPISEKPQLSPLATSVDFLATIILTAAPAATGRPVRRLLNFAAAACSTELQQKSFSAAATPATSIKVKSVAAAAAAMPSVETIDAGLSLIPSAVISSATSFTSRFQKGQENSPQEMLKKLELANLALNAVVGGTGSKKRKAEASACVSSDEETNSEEDLKQDDSLKVRINELTAIAQTKTVVPKTSELNAEDEVALVMVANEMSVLRLDRTVKVFRIGNEIYQINQIGKGVEHIVYEFIANNKIVRPFISEKHVCGQPYANVLLKIINHLNLNQARVPKKTADCLSGYEKLQVLGIPLPAIYYRSNDGATMIVERIPHTVDTNRYSGTLNPTARFEEFMKDDKLSKALEFAKLWLTRSALARNLLIDDFTPSNVGIKEDGTVVVLDWTSFSPDNHETAIYESVVAWSKNNNAVFRYIIEKFPEEVKSKFTKQWSSSVNSRVAETNAKLQSAS